MYFTCSWKIKTSSDPPPLHLLYNGTEGGDANSKQAGSWEHRLKEKFTAANFSIQLTSAEGQRWREREVGGRLGRKMGKKGPNSYYWWEFGASYWAAFPGGSVVKKPCANEGDVGSIPGLRRSTREKNGSPPLQYSCLENPMDRRAW